MVSPRPPYITCPFCGQNAFGVLMITGDSYVRRCASCHRPTGTEKAKRYPLPPLNKRILYLDQFAIRRIYQASVNPKTANSPKLSREWISLIDKIKRLIRYQLIICPISDIHIKESLVWKDYKETRLLLHKLSCGVSFSSITEIIIRQLLAHASSWIEGRFDVEPDLKMLEALDDNPNKWSDFVHVSTVLSYTEDRIDQLRSIRDESHEELTDVFIRWQKQKDKGFEYWFNEEINGFAIGTIRIFIEHFVKMNRAEYTPDELLLLNYSLSINTLHSLISLFSNHTGSPQETADLLSKYLQAKYLKSVPFLKIGGMLWASMALKAASGQKRPPNRGTINDVNFISIFLPYCDAMMIDKVNHSYLSYEPLKSEIDYNTKIFSVLNIKKFLDYLDQIESQATSEHWAALEEAYGISRK
jgi:hypothetical protein